MRSLLISIPTVRTTRGSLLLCTVYVCTMCINDKRTIYAHILTLTHRIIVITYYAGRRVQIHCPYVRTKGEGDVVIAPPSNDFTPKFIVFE